MSFIIFPVETVLRSVVNKHRIYAFSLCPKLSSLGEACSGNSVSIPVFFFVSLVHIRAIRVKAFQTSYNFFSSSQTPPGIGWHLYKKYNVKPLALLAVFSLLLYLFLEKTASIKKGIP
jgi:hypothetical protein